MVKGSDEIGISRLQIEEQDLTAKIQKSISVNRTKSIRSAGRMNNGLDSGNVGSPGGREGPNVQHRPNVLGEQGI